MNAAHVPLATANTIHALRGSSFIVIVAAAGPLVPERREEAYEGGDEVSISAGSGASAASFLVAAGRLAEGLSGEAAEGEGGTRRRSGAVERGEGMARVQEARLGVLRVNRGHVAAGRFSGLATGHVVPDGRFGVVGRCYEARGRGSKEGSLKRRVDEGQGRRRAVAWRIGISAEPGRAYQRIWASHAGEGACWNDQ